MALEAQDIQKIVDGHGRARAAVDEGNLLQAAKVLCEEFNSLLHMESFWDSVRDAAQSVQENTADAIGLLNEVTVFIDLERDVFKGLGIPEEKWGPILKDAFSGRNRSVDAAALASGQLVIELNAFRRDLAEAKDLICQESNNPRGRFASEWIVSEMGVRVLADSAALAVNATLFAVPPLPLVSIFSGILAVRQDVPAIIHFIKSWWRRG
jgi:hypothetical protein